MRFAYGPDDQCINRFFFLSPLKSDFPSFQSETEGVQTNVDRLFLSQTGIQSILLASEGGKHTGTQDVRLISVSPRQEDTSRFYVFLHTCKACEHEEATPPKICFLKATT